MWNAVIFDVDGTLLDTEKIYMEAWRLAGAAMGYTVTQDVLLRTRAIPTSVGKQIFKEALGEDFDYEAARDARVRIAEELIAAADPAQLLMPHAPASRSLRKRHFMSSSSRYVGALSSQPITPARS